MSVEKLMNLKLDFNMLKQKRKMRQAASSSQRTLIPAYTAYDDQKDEQDYNKGKPLAETMSMAAISSKSITIHKEKPPLAQISPASI